MHKILMRWEQFYGNKLKIKQKPKLPCLLYISMITTKIYNFFEFINSKFANVDHQEKKKFPAKKYISQSTKIYPF